MACGQELVRRALLPSAPPLLLLGPDFWNSELLALVGDQGARYVLGLAVGRGPHLGTGDQPLTCSDRRKLRHSCCHWMSSPTRPAATRSIIKSSSTWGTRDEWDLLCQPGLMATWAAPSLRKQDHSLLLTHPLSFFHSTNICWASGPELKPGDRIMKSLANSWPSAGPSGPLSRSVPSALYLVDAVQTQRLATEPQEQGQELGAEGGGSNEVQRGVTKVGFSSLTPPSHPPLSGQVGRAEQEGRAGVGVRPTNSRDAYVTSREMTSRNARDQSIQCPQWLNRNLWEGRGKCPSGGRGVNSGLRGVGMGGFRKRTRKE